MKVLYVTEPNNKLKQLAKQFGRQKRVVVKYNGDFKYVHVYDNRKGAKYPGMTLGYDEFRELMNIVKFIDMADSFFKEKPLPSEVFKKRAGEMEIEHEEVCIFNPNPPQDNISLLCKKKQIEREHEEREEREEQTHREREEQTHREREEQTHREREEQTHREREEQTHREREEQTHREHETQIHGEHKEHEERGHVDEGEMLDVEALLDFLKTIEDSKLAFPALEFSTCCTPSTTDSIPLTSSAADTTPFTSPSTTDSIPLTSSAADITPFTSTSADTLLLTPPIHIHVEEEAAIIPPNLTSTDATILAPQTPIHMDSYTPVIEPITPVKVKKGLKIKNPGFKRHRSFPFSSLPPYKN